MPAVPRVFLVVAIAAGSLSIAIAKPSRGAGAAPYGRVSEEVTAAIGGGAGTVRVNVTLRAQPPSRNFSRSDLARSVGVSQDAVLGRLAPGDLDVVHRYSSIPGLAVLASPAGIAKLGADPDVVAVTLDGTGSGGAVVEASDAKVSVQPLSHSVPLIRANLVQQNGITGSGVTVAILDSGADTDHPDLADSIVAQECFLTGPGSRCPNGLTRQSGAGSGEDDLGHGSNVTGIITSNGVVSSPGVAPGARVLLYKVLNSSNAGQFSDWDAALNDIIANHPEVRVVNMSLVSFTTYSSTCDFVDPTTAAAFNTLNAAGAVIFVSSGNNAAKSAMSYPACASGAVSVGAVYDQTFTSSTFFGCTNTPAPVDVPPCWSNSSASLDLLAPGSFIVSDGLAGGTSTYTGTSQASPHAAGVAALLFQEFPSSTPAQVEALMKATGVPRNDPANSLTKPRIDALAAAGSPTLGGADEDVSPLRRPPGTAQRELVTSALLLVLGALVLAVFVSARALNGRR